MHLSRICLLTQPLAKEGATGHAAVKSPSTSAFPREGLASLAHTLTVQVRPDLRSSALHSLIFDLKCASRRRSGCCHLEGTPCKVQGINANRPVRVRGQGGGERINCLPSPLTLKKELIPDIALVPGFSSQIFSRTEDRLCFLAKL